MTSQQFLIDTIANNLANVNTNGFKKTRVDFQVSQQLGVQGFPSMVLRDGEVLRALSQGYRPFDQLSPLLDQWVEEPPEMAQAEIDARPS